MSIDPSPRNVLLLDASFAAVPIHDELVLLGCTVWTVGNRPHDALALAFPERWIQADYSDADIIRSIINEYAIADVVPGCTDVSMATFARLGGNRAYPYDPDVDRILNIKSRFRDLCEELDLPAPRAFLPECLPSRGHFICKPTDGFSGRGVSVFDATDAEATRAAFELARGHSPSGSILCESFISGSLFSYSAFLTDRKITRAFIVREGSRYDLFAVDTSYVVHPNDMPEAVVIGNAIERIAHKLNLCDGLVHVQFIVGEEGPRIIEITRRCPGDLYSRLIQESTGFRYAACYASYFLGLSEPEWEFVPRSVLRHTVKQRAGTIFTQFTVPTMGAVMRLIPLRTPGERLSGVGYQRTALMFIEAPSYPTVRHLFDQLTNTLSSR
ncbi:putative carbamoyl-phosphate-synthetase protein [Gluconacetobacter diazotrophicus PA1 5]|uniref:ATP-grasp domain-containing protein n=1 Tax=Gluconacetobacter diazotrophicus TaxID=33996 RepID=UPI000173D3FA|nr:ATP-grasp domain-containing protein [Gluconacetobacter diazotrophicus]ACI53091.1 putative carbamoyl-phosphate-synthetase protein [Gluconacetobacter diazotrophicus PA1 5]TWB07762.1 putative ATP-grasp superfamily ATP-dependent carboligase [Gluconacetobacter diazotrophicus]